MKHFLAILLVLVSLIAPVFSYAQSPETTDEPVASTIVTTVVVPSATPMTSQVPSSTSLPTVTSTPTLMPTTFTEPLDIVAITPNVATSIVSTHTPTPTVQSVSPTSQTEVTDVVPIPENLATVSGTDAIVPTIEGASVVLTPITGTTVAMTPTLQITPLTVDVMISGTPSIDSVASDFIDYPYINQMDDTDHWFYIGEWNIITGTDGDSYWQLIETNETATLESDIKFAPVTGFEVLLTFSSRMDGNQSLGRVEASHDQISWFVLDEVESSIDWITNGILLFADFAEPIYIRFVWTMPTISDESISTVWHIDDLQLVSLTQTTPTPHLEISATPTTIVMPTLTVTPIPIDYCLLDKVQDRILTIDDLVLLRIQPIYGQTINSNLAVYDYDLNRDGVFDVLDLQVMTQYIGIDCHTISLNDQVNQSG